MFNLSDKSDDLKPSWVDVSDRSRRSNPFFTYEFISCLEQHIYNVETLSIFSQSQKEKPSVWDIMAIHTVQKAGGLSLLKSIEHPFIPYCCPISSTSEAKMWETYLSELLSSGVDVLHLANIRMSDEERFLISEWCVAHHLRIAEVDHWQRAVLIAEGDPEVYLRHSLGKKRFKEAGRLWRRLSETGDLVYRRHLDSSSLATALDRFLELEASGWKGEKKTALASDDRNRAFIVDLVSRLSKRGAVFIDELVIDEQAIASMISFQEGDQVWTWKIGYDETLAQYSPGVLLMLEATRTFMNDPNTVYVDSCAIPDHPMINTIWRDRQDMYDLVIGLKPGSGMKVRVVAGIIQGKKSIKAILKTLLNRS